jgi:hypothetical protein
MNTAARLLVTYLVIFLLFSLAVAGLARAIGPVEFAILVAIALIAAAYRTFKIVRPSPAVVGQ